LFKELGKSEIIRSEEFFIKFLSVEDRNKLEKVKKALTKIPPPKFFTDITHPSGTVTVKLDGGKIRLVQSIEKYATRSYELYNQLLKITNEISDHLKMLSSAFKEQAEIYKELTSLAISIKVS
jgi:copper chaperone CopZ